ncbi:MAG TPA: hypothetical protein VMF64_13635 [Steroidobacteraceae bacterium]|nr:hypothetical protein [Steroidobacteraceae bacterium]
MAVRTAFLRLHYVASFPGLPLFGAFYPAADEPKSCATVPRNLLQIVILPIVALIVLLLYTTAWLIEAINDLLPPASRLANCSDKHEGVRAARSAPRETAAGMPP